MSGDGILEVLIVAYGAEGIQRVADNPHPETAGVRYIVSWQRGGASDSAIPRSLLSRPDFTVYPTDSSGISANRNAAFSHASAPLLLLSDDDLGYTRENLLAVIDTMERHPDVAVAAFRYDSPDFPRSYPDRQFDLRRPPKGYFITSFEIALRRSLILDASPDGDLLRLNTRFGIGSRFCAGEEDLFVDRLLQAGLTGRYFPKTIATHNGPTTGMKRASDPEFIRTKGAVVSVTHPLTWPLRMAAHALRARRDHSAPRGYCRHWLRGAREAMSPTSVPVRERHNQWWWLTLLLTAAIYTVITFFTPVQLDDYIFMAAYRDVNDGSETLTVPGLLRFWLEIRSYDNGRIANLISPLTTLSATGRLLFPLLNGLAAAFIIGAIARISLPASYRRSAFPVCLVWGMTLFLLPWRNSLFVADYSLNYIWGAAVTLCFILQAMRLSSGRRGASEFAATLLLVIVAGGWHEGFAFTTLAGFIIYTLSAMRAGRHFDARWWTTGILYAAAALAFFLCPGMMLRMKEQLGEAAMGASTLKLLADTAPVVMLVAAIAICLPFRRSRRTLTEAAGNPFFLIFLTIAAGGTLLSLGVNHQPRSSFWPDIAAIICLLILVRRPVALFVTRRQWRMARIAASLAAAIVCTAVSLPIIIWQKRYSDEDARIMRMMEKSPSGTVFLDIIPPESLPAYTLRIPTKSAWVTPFHLHALREYTGKPFCAVVDPALRHASAEGGRALEGSDSIFVYDGKAIFSTSGVHERPEVHLSDFRLQDGSAAYAVFAPHFPFLTEEGDTLVYIRPTGIDPSTVTAIDIQ